VNVPALHLPRPVTDRPLIRPPDPLIVGRTLTYGAYDSAEATRRYVHLAFRDCHTAIDLTYAHGGFWKRPYPPGLTITTSNIDPSSGAELHLDFTATGLPDGAYDLAIYDPPHLADLGADSIMGRRFDTVKGTPGLHLLVTAGVREAWRIAIRGVLIKLADTSHGSEFLQLSRWVYDELGVEPYFVAHTMRPPLGDGRRRVQRVPWSNGAVYLIFRRDYGKHHDFDRQYDRQQMSHMASQRARRRCAMCDRPIGDRRGVAATCSATCRKRRQREGAR
jgi:hypothetical protein